MQFQKIAHLKDEITRLKADRKMILESMEASLKVSEVQEEHMKNINKILKEHLKAVDGNKKIEMLYEFFK